MKGFLLDIFGFRFLTEIDKKFLGEFLLYILIILLPLLFITLFINCLGWSFNFLLWSFDFEYFIPFYTNSEETYLGERVLILFGLLLAMFKFMDD